MVSKAMLNSLVEKQLSYVPEDQDLYTFCDGTWTSSQSPVLPSATAPEDVPLKSLHLITWNIDFMASKPRERMAAALNYLKNLITTIPRSSAVVVFLQEIMESNNPEEENANDLTQLINAPWIQECFNITDIDSIGWDSPYNQVTLIDRRLTTLRVSRLRFVSEYQRNALFVDIRLHSEGAKFLRLCNVHLDSSYGSMRPIQWKAVAKYLQNSDKRIAASILAGDCNANQPRDKTEPQENGFKDAYLELGGVEEDENGATWGFQSMEWKRWGRQRLDKEVFWGNLQVEKLERIGIGVQISDQVTKTEMEKQDFLPFATDHYGLMGEYVIEGRFQTLSE